MNQYIKSTKENLQPKKNFACSDCPNSLWQSGSLDSEGLTSNLFCYCQKLFKYTFDSTETRGELESKRVIYMHIEKCQGKEEFLNDNKLGE